MKHFALISAALFAVLTVGIKDCDGDGDGWAACPRKGAVLCDCDDKDASIHPNAVEACDERDNDCDGTIDEPLECRPALQHAGASFDRGV